MISPVPGRWRLEAAFAVVAVALAGFACAQASLVRTGHENAQARIRVQQTMTVPLPGRPGSIFARERRRYASVVISRRVPGVYVDPRMLKESQSDEVAIGISKAVGMSTQDRIKFVPALQETLLQRRESGYVRVVKALDEQQAQNVHNLKLPAVGIDYHWQREYPNGSLAATVLGYRRPNGEPGAGAELSFRQSLLPTDGEKVMLADARRRAIWSDESKSTPPRDGYNVFLSIDLSMQAMLEEALAQAVSTYGGKWGSGLIVDPWTGQVLAMASVPTFNPAAYQDSPADSRVNRCISMPVEAGSAMKPIFAAAAVEQGLLNYNTMLNCENGHYRAPKGGTITDHGQSYGMLSLADVIKFSSNIGMAKVGEMMGNRRLFEWAKAFGLADRTGIPLPGESGGIVRPLRKWDGYSLRRVPFGQEISTTSLQLAMAFSALSNGGVLMEPQLVDYICRPDGTVIHRGMPKAVRRVISPATAAATVAAMRGVVEAGTAKEYPLDGWTSFGKTGTAQIPGPAGYREGAYVASYIAGAPADRPRVVCLISVYWPDPAKGYYGGKVAAPYVKQVLEQALAYLNVPLDKPAAVVVSR
ncbi:MAG: penicillin-binding protein 2 [Planctomycetaceae bacterium]|nr:penicillin-binding protein 2 [Planctomycetaceae bacterium]